MLTIARLFGKSPFAPLQTHMNKVTNCIEKLTKMFEAIANDEFTKLEHLVEDLSQLEHEADLTKNDIRNHLPKSLFMPIDRGHFLEILALQDSIADCAEEIGLVLSYRPLTPLKSLHKEMHAFVVTSCEVFWGTKQIISEIDELLESSFGGIEAEKVKAMVEETAHKEHEAQKEKRRLLQFLFTEGDALSPPAFAHWNQLIELVGVLAQTSEKLANRIRMVLELK